MQEEARAWAGALILADSYYESKRTNELLKAIYDGLVKIAGG